AGEPGDRQVDGADLVALARGDAHAPGGHRVLRGCGNGAGSRAGHGAASTTRAPRATLRLLARSADRRPSGGPIAVVGRVDLDVLLPLGRDLVLGRDRVHRAGLHARVAVDALVGIYVELVVIVEVGLVLRRVDAVHRADLDAGVVLDADAGLVDHVGHLT